jgi:D-threonate/D-erythronate kinase
MAASSAKILIVADDLSGAADCAVTCFNAGLASLVVLDGDAETPQSEALAIDTDSRRLTGARAAEVTARMVRRHAGPDTRLIYKKMDSTVRGNFAVEIAACLGVIRDRPSATHAVAIVAPAFPSAGRTTRDGHQLLNGRKIEETSVWQNEHIRGRAHLPDMLAAAGLTVAHLDLATVRNRTQLAQAVRDAAKDHQALVCDAENDDDLQAIAQAGQALGPSTIWAGSAGLARHLPVAAGLVRTPPTPDANQPRLGPVICAVGSLSEVSREQFGHLPAQDGVASFTIPPDLLRAGPGSRDWAEQSAALHRAVAEGQDIAILIGAAANPDPAEGLILCAALGRLLAPHLASARGLIATGGETARALLLAAGVPALQLMGEVEPGIPYSVAASGGAAAGLPVITKAGAFGRPETLRHCRALLRDGVHPLPSGQGLPS